MDQLLELYTTYGTTAVNYLFMFTGVVTLLFVFRLLLRLFNLSKTMNTLLTTQESILGNVEHFTTVYNGLIMHQVKKKEKKEKAPSTIVIKYLRKKKIIFK